MRPSESETAESPHMQMQSTIDIDPVIYLAIELSASTWLVVSKIPPSEKTGLHRMEAGDSQALLALIADLRKKVAAKLGVEASVMSCFEAGRDGFWLDRLLAEHGVINHVVEPTSILVNRRARRAKTDRLDAQGLLRILAAHAKGDHDVCSVVRVPTKDDTASRTIQALRRIRGIGDNFAAVLTREVFYRSFENRRQIASYLGLTPTPFQSGGMDRDRRISRAGNARARKTLIQLAWLWLRYQPDSSLTCWFRERVGNLQGRPRRIALVAMARSVLQTHTERSSI